MARTLRVADHVFVIRFWPTVITLCMLSILLVLGTWQVQRLHWKTHLIATINQRIILPPVDIDTALEDSDADYRPVKVIGLFQHDREFFLSAISQDGQGGYDVLTPLQLDDGRYVLVNRGWVPYDHRDAHTRFDGQLFGPVTVTGLLRKPHHGWLQPANDPANNNWYNIDLPAMAQWATIREFVPYVLDADATKNAGGYPIGGQTHVVLPNNHFVYALTWYGLAVALLVLYGVDARQKK